MRRRFAIAACLVAVLGLSIHQSAQTPWAPEDPLEGESVHQVPLDRPVSGIVADVEDASVNATSTLPPTPNEAVVDGSAAIEADVVRYTHWGFDLPLQENGTGFRFVDDDGTLYDNVVIAVAWTDDDGVRRAWPGTATLVIERDGERLDRQASPGANGILTFQVAYSDLVAGASAGWTLGVELEGELTWWSPYDSRGAQRAMVAGSSGAAIRGLGSPVWVDDADADGEPDDRDNCPWTRNEDQANLDGDLLGDVCDPDDDGDGWTDEAEGDVGSDPRDAQSTPLDRDADGFGNDVEADANSDPDDAASVPDDPDADGHSNHAETAAGSDPFNPASVPSDPDADGIPSVSDNCPRHANAYQEDGDQDGIGDACDTRPTDGPDGDQDGDGVRNRDDVCRLVPDPGQADLDGDGAGDACDPDQDGDRRPDGADAFPRDGLEWLDSDKDGTGDNADADDDNDGLSDVAEASIGTDPLASDTDKDTYSDLDELTLGSDATDPHDPPYLPTEVRAVAEAGGVRISWQGSGDPRIAGYTVWDRGSLRVVTHAPADADTAFDSAVTSHAVMYAVQPRFHGQMFLPAPDRSVDATVRMTGTVTELVERAPERQGDATQAPPPLTPAEDAPGLEAAVLLAALALAYAIRRRR